MTSHDDTARRRPSRPAYIPDDPLLCAADAAVEAGMALSTWWRDVRRGTMPGPIYLNPKQPRWRRSEIRAAVEACRLRKRAA